MQDTVLIYFSSVNVMTLTCPRMGGASLSCLSAFPEGSGFTATCLCFNAYLIRKLFYFSTISVDKTSGFGILIFNYISSDTVHMQSVIAALKRCVGRGERDVLSHSFPLWI